MALHPSSLRTFRWVVGLTLLAVASLPAGVGSAQSTPEVGYGPIDDDGCTELFWNADAGVVLNVQITVADDYHPGGQVIIENWAAIDGREWVCVEQLVWDREAQSSAGRPTTALFEFRLSDGSYVVNELVIEPPGGGPPATGEPGTGWIASFEAQPSAVAPGECVALSWVLEGESPVAPPSVSASTSDAWRDGSPCPQQTTTFSLHVEYADGSVATAHVVVIVEAALPANTMPPILVLTHSERLIDRFLDECANWPAPEPGERPSLCVPGTWEEVVALLDDHYGPGRYRLLDYADYPEADAAPESGRDHLDVAREVIEAEGRPRYILILGGPRVVPFHVELNPVTQANPASSDRDWGVLTDNAYGDYEAPDGIPDIPVARLPDGGSFWLMKAVFEANEQPLRQGSVSAYTHGHPLRPYVDNMTRRLLHNDTDHFQWNALPLYTPDLSASPTVWIPSSGRTTYAYFILHGSDVDTSVWTGEDPHEVNSSANAANRYPEAFTVDDVIDAALVYSQACYGAYLDGTQTSEDSIALAFLLNGASAYIGSTASSYSSLDAWDGSAGITVCPIKGSQVWGESCASVGPATSDPLVNGAQSLAWAVLEGTITMHPLDAFFDGKEVFRTRSGMDTVGEEKAYLSYVYYGIPPVIP